MPTVVLEPGVLVLVTGVNGLIGSHVADQLLKRGYRVRGVVRDVGKNKWVAEYFEEKYPDVGFELVAVPDMTVAGCYDGVVDGVQGFIHVASPLGDFADVDSAITIGVSGGLNALKACAKTASITRFVFTSSSLAATFPKADVEFAINGNSYNDEALQVMREDPTRPGLFKYAAMKSETEKAMWKWMQENKPEFTLNTILPNANFGPLLLPQHQGFPSTIAWARAAWTGEYLIEHTQVIGPQWFISPADTAQLHISALIHGDVVSERLFGFAERWSFNSLLAIFREAYPEETFPGDVEGLGVDRMSVPSERALEVLGWVKDSGWDGLENSLKEMSEGWLKRE